MATSRTSSVPLLESDQAPATYYETLDREHTANEGFVELTTPVVYGSHSIAGTDDPQPKGSAGDSMGNSDARM